MSTTSKFVKVYYVQVNHCNYQEQKGRKEEEWSKEALKSAEIKQKQGIPLPRNLAYRLVYECTKQRDVELGRRVQFLMLQSGLHTIAPLSNPLIRLFIACQDVIEAKQVFCSIFKPDLYSWNAIIHGLVKLGMFQVAIGFYGRINNESITPDKLTFLSIIKSCGLIGSLWRAIQIHEKIIGTELEFDIVIGNSLVSMYAKCGNLELAHGVFSRLHNPDIISWGAIISAYAQDGESHHAFDYFEKMQSKGLVPDKVIFLSILKACSIGTIQQGRRIHELIIETGVQLNVVLLNTIVDMYAKCGSLEEASGIFDRLGDPDVISWNVIIAGCALHCEGHLALRKFEAMQHQGANPDKVTFLNILKACSSIKSLEQARFIHQHFIASGSQLDAAVKNMLVDTYAKCGSLEEAEKVFANLQNPDIISWSSMIEAYAQYGEGSLAFVSLEMMQNQGIKPNKITFLSIIKACSFLYQGRWIHEQIMQEQFQFDIVAGNALVDMYARCGSLEETCRAYDVLQSRDVISCNAIITGYGEYGQACLAFECFENMQREGIVPSKVTFLSILKVCGSTGNIEQGRNVHEHLLMNGLQSDIVLGSSLVDMYAKCGSLEEAHGVYIRLPNPGLVPTNALIAGYAQYGELCNALACFQEMWHQGTRPDKYSFSSILKACSSVGALHQGICIHEQAMDFRLEFDIVVGNTLIDMYAKCGSMKLACGAFNMLQNRNLLSWNALVTGYAQLGQFRLAVQCFDNMQCNMIRPDDVAFIAIFTAFGHAGLVEEGLWYFRTMKECYAVTVNIFHISCMVDLLGYAGYFKEAENLIQAFVQPSLCLWLTLLNCCRMHLNINLGIRCFEEIVCIDPLCSTAYILMSDILDKYKQRANC